MTEQQNQTDNLATVEIYPIGGVYVEYVDNVRPQEHRHQKQKPTEQETRGLEHIIMPDPHTISLEGLSTQKTPQSPMSDMELFGNVIDLGGDCKGEQQEQSIAAGNLDLSRIVVEDTRYPKLNQEQILILERAMIELKPKIEIMKKGAENGFETCGEIYTEWTIILEDFFSSNKLRPMYELEIRTAKVGLMSLNFSYKGDGRIKELLTYIEKINERMVETYKLVGPEQELKEQGKEKPKPREFRSAYL